MNRNYVPIVVSVCLMAAAGMFTVGVTTLVEASRASQGVFDPSRDTYAAWLTAIFTGGSVLVAAWATWLLRETLVQSGLATQAALDANATAREIGQAQVRSYLTVTGGSFRFDGMGIYYNVAVKNVGMTPAMKVSMRVSIWFTGRPNSMHYCGGGVGAVGVSQEASIFAAINNSDNPSWRVFGGTDNKPPEMPGVTYRELMTGSDGLHCVDITLGWTDVFGRRQNSTQSMRAVTSLGGDEENSVRCGELTLGSISLWRDLPDRP